MTKLEKLAHYIGVYQREIHSGKYNQSVPFHEGVALDAIEALHGISKYRTVDQAINEIETEMVILCLSPISFKRVSNKRARDQAEQLLAGAV
jgi:hypothetical protein